jgi:SAM-dependent methyltransferase
MITKLLQEKLICPACSGALDFTDSSITCLSCRAVYDVVDGIPVMMSPGSTKASESENTYWEDYWTKIPMHDISRVHEQPEIISVMDHVIPLWEKYGKDVFLEAGSGSGRLLYIMGKRGIPVIGFDNSTGALKYTARFLSLAGIKDFHLVCGDMRSLPFKENSLGMIYGGGSIEHFDGQQRAIDSMRKTLIPGTVLTLTYPYISISTLTYRQLFGNIPDLPVLKQFFMFLHETVLKKKFMRFGYEKSFTIGTMEKFYKKSGFKTIYSGLFDTFLDMTFIKDEKMKNFLRRLSRFKPFWPMVHTTGIK